MGSDNNLPSPAFALNSPPVSCSTDGTHSSIYTPPISSSSASSPSSSSEKDLQKLSSNIESLIYQDAYDSFSDIIIYVAGQTVPLHRCILASRCQFFKTLFSKSRNELANIAPKSDSKEDSSILKIQLEKLIDKFLVRGTSRIGFDSFLLVVSFLYSGRQSVPSIKCIDKDCPHEACRPAVEFAIEMLCLSSIFDIAELKILWQNTLTDMVEKAQADDLFLILVAADTYGATALFQTSRHAIAASEIDTTDLLKQLPITLAEEIVLLRSKMGQLQPEMLNPAHERECHRIRKALDSDDVELVQLLLREGKMTLDGAHALHYAASYCNPNTVQDLLELGLSNPNIRNNRGFTVLHIAALRREPAILAGLLCKGANPLDLTPDGKTAFQLCSRMIRRFDYQSQALIGEELQKDRLSVEILDQAGRENPFVNAIFPPAVDDKEIFMRLLYLENRVAVARLLFPHEAKLVTGIAHLEATSEFTGYGVADFSNISKEGSVDLNKIPSYRNYDPSMPIPKITDAIRRRMLALQKAVEVGKRIFPRCTIVLNNFMDDDICELSLIQRGSIEEQKTKKRRYTELKDMLADAFKKDVAAMERHKAEKFEL